MINEAHITGTGVWVPPNVITNEELVEAYNEFAHTDPERFKPSSAEFILKASGIKQRHVIDRVGILDPKRLHPYIPDRPNDVQSIQCEMSVNSARGALEQARLTGEDIDQVIAACSNFQRPYPAVAIEVQDQLGIVGAAMDVNVGCCSATFAIRMAAQSVMCGESRGTLVVVPELVTGHVNFRDRDSHFIFSDASCAIVVQPLSTIRTPERYQITSTKSQTQFSNNIRNNFGFLARCDEANANNSDKLFTQKGRGVFKEVVPMVVRHLRAHVGDELPNIKRYWLHQANSHMNKLITKMLLGHEASHEEAPTILENYANTAAAGSIIAFHQNRQDFAVGDQGVICSFGAGYSIGSILLRRV